jgi:transposase
MRSKRTRAGTVEPGRSVSAKRGVNRSIIDQRWGMLADTFKNKLFGGELQIVDRAYTSQPYPAGMPTMQTQLLHATCKQAGTP